MASKRKFQVFFERESQPGVAVADGSLFTAARGKLQVKDPVLSINPEQYDREVLRGSLSPGTSLTGIVEAEFSFACELAGVVSPSGSSVPMFGLLLESCGMRQAQLRKFTIDSPFTGTRDVFEHLEVINGGASETGLVVSDVWEGATSMRYINTGGDTDFETAQVVTGAGGATCNTTSASVDGGQSWFPAASPQITLTVGSIAAGTPADGDLYIGATSGAILVAKSASIAAALQPFELLDGTVTATETLTNQTQAGVNLVNVTAPAQLYIPTLSMAIIEDGRFKKIKGARGTFTMSGEIGKPVFLNFTFKGSLETVGNKSPVVGIVPDQQIPPRFLGSTVKVGVNSAGLPGFNSFATEHTPRVTSFSFDAGAQVSIQRDATQATGTTVAYHTQTRTPSGTLDPEARPEAAFPFLAALKDGTPFRARFGIGSTNGNRFLITAPACKITSEGAGEREGFATSDLSFALSSLGQNGSDRDDAELVIIYSISGSF